MSDAVTPEVAALRAEKLAKAQHAVTLAMHSVALAREACWGAVPMAVDILADLQRSWNRTSYSNRAEADAVPMDIPDPDSPKGRKPNPEWHFQIIQQVQDFGLVYLLLALHAVDPAVADSAAASLADLWDSGDSIGEFGWEWHEHLLKGEPVNLPGIPTVALAAPA